MEKSEKPFLYGISGIVAIVAIVAIFGYLNNEPFEDDLVGRDLYGQAFKRLPSPNIKLMVSTQWTRVVCTYPNGDNACDTGEVVGSYAQCPSFCSQEGTITCESSALDEDGNPLTDTLQYNLDYDNDEYACNCIGGTWVFGADNCCGDDGVNDDWTYGGGNCIDGQWVGGGDNCNMPSACQSAGGGCYDTGLTSCDNSECCDGIQYICENCVSGNFQWTYTGTGYWCGYECGG